MIIGERVQLIPLNDECFDLTYKWVNNPSLRLYTGTRFPITKVEHEKWFSKRCEDLYNKTFGIQVKETNKIIGLVANNHFDALDRTTSISIYLGEVKDRNHGYGKETLDLFTQFCFNMLNVRKTWAYIFGFNEASIKLFTKSEYIQEGILKEHIYRDGNYHDVVVMGRINKNE